MKSRNPVARVVRAIRPQVIKSRKIYSRKVKHNVNR